MLHQVVLESRKRKNLGLNLIDQPTSRCVTSKLCDSAVPSPETQNATDSSGSDEVRSSPSTSDQGIDVTQSVFGNAVTTPTDGAQLMFGESVRPIDRLFYSTPSLMSEGGEASESIFTEQHLYNNDQLKAEMNKLNQVEAELSFELNELNRLSCGGMNIEEERSLSGFSTLSSVSSVTVTSVSDNEDCGRLKYYV